MPMPELTLSQVRKSPKLKRLRRASDFLDDDDRVELQKANLKSRRDLRAFDDVDAYCAEILARFGYDAYNAWNNGEIDEDFMMRMVMAERARDKATLLPLESIVVQMVGACIRREKGQKSPKGPGNAQKILKEELRVARGEKK